MESLPERLVNPESIKATADFLSRKLQVDSSRMPSLVTLSDAFIYNQKTGNVQVAAKIGNSIHSQLMSIYENCPFDSSEKLISDALREKENNNPSSAIRYLDTALQLPSNWRRKIKILKLRGECYLAMGDTRTAAINFTEATRSVSSESVCSSDDLREYAEVLIGLTKSEVLCGNLEAASLISHEAINLISNHDLKETIHRQEVELYYLAAKRLIILSQSAKDKVDQLTQACSLCQQAIALIHVIDQTGEASNLVEELGDTEKGHFFALKCEVQLLSASVFQVLQRKEEAKTILKEMKEFLLNIAVVFETLSANSVAGGKVEFLKISRRLFSWIGRVLILSDEKALSIIWLNKSLVAFFSVILPALPDMLSFYEEILPLLDAVTATWSHSIHENRSPFQQTVDMCKDVAVKHGINLNNFYEVLKTLTMLFTQLGRMEEAIVVAKTGLNMSDLVWGSNVVNRSNYRCRMLLYLAQIHHLNSTNLAYDRTNQQKLAEKYYLTNRGSMEEFGRRKDLSYANFLCEQRRFADADTVLRDINNAGQLVCNTYIYCTYFARACYGPGVKKSVEVDGELVATIGDIMHTTVIRVLVGMGKKSEAVAACEKLLSANPVNVHETIIGKRPFCMPYLIEACQRELLFLLSDEDRKIFQNCDFPLEPPSLAKLYYMLNEYVPALKYIPEEVHSHELMEMKISCFRLAGNNLVKTSREDESRGYFMNFLSMLHIKESFLDKPFLTQCAILNGYSFANDYHVFRVLGMMLCGRGNLDGAIQCYERCLELDEDFTCNQNLVATLAELYQSKALTACVENEESIKIRMNLALSLFEKLLQTTSELTTFVECSFASLLFRLERYTEAVEHFKNVVEREGEEVSSSRKRISRCFLTFDGKLKLVVELASQLKSTLSTS